MLLIAQPYSPEARAAHLLGASGVPQDDHVSLTEELVKECPAHLSEYHEASELQEMHSTRGIQACQLPLVTLVFP